MNVLAIDVGGTHVKLLMTGEAESRKFDSGPQMTAEQMVAGVHQGAEGWQFDVASIGYPGPVLHGRALAEPKNLGAGWVGFDFATALRCPIKMINDAAMQALGSYEGGKMLFLGLGTGLGSALIVGGILQAMELAHLPYRKGTFEDYVGERGLERLGRRRWERRVHDVVAKLIAALEAEYVVIGGGNARKLKTLPEGARLGDNAKAFEGGFRLWDEANQPAAQAIQAIKPQAAPQPDSAHLN